MHWRDLIAIMLLAACARGEEPLAPVLPPPEMMQLPEVPAEVKLPKAVEHTRAGILKYAEAGSLSGLASIAAKSPQFASNFGGQDHRDYWDLMRRIGVDPNVRLRQLFDERPGMREVDGITRYVWPDLAAKEAEELIPEKLSFEDRRRLEELVGAEGIARIRAGEGYPGMRTAISEDGTWIYFVLGMDGDEG
jgi:hypothetical protein